MTADFLSHSVPDYAAAVGYCWVSIVCLVWAFGVLAQAVQQPCAWGPVQLPPRLYFLKPIEKRTRRARCILSGFNFWFGCFLGFSDAALYGTLGFQLLRNHNPIPLWGMIFVMVGVIAATISVILWGRDQ